MKGECFWNRFSWVIGLICFISIGSSLISFDSLLDCVMGSSIGWLINVSIRSCLHSERAVPRSPKSLFLVLVLQSLHYSLKMKRLASCGDGFLLMNNRSIAESLNFGAWKENSWYLTVNLSFYPNTLASGSPSALLTVQENDWMVSWRIKVPFFVLLILFAKSNS